MVKHYFAGRWRVGRNKILEIELFKTQDSFYLGTQIEWSWRTNDHQGGSFEINLGIYHLLISFYDTRHKGETE